MNPRLTFYVESIAAGETPNVPAFMREELFKVLTLADLDAFLSRLRNKG